MFTVWQSLGKTIKPQKERPYTCSRKSLKRFIFAPYEFIVEIRENIVGIRAVSALVFAPVFMIGPKKKGSCIYNCLLLSTKSPFANLAWWPLHGALAKYVDVQMLYSLLSILASVDHAAIAVLETLLSTDLFDLEHHVGHQLGMLVCKVVERSHMDLRNHQHMNRSLWVSIAEHSYLIVFVDHVGRNLAVCQLAKNAIIHIP
jgi:hypothetical protein